MELIVEARFRGFEGVALGGYAGGLLAADLPVAEVKLRRPIPVGRRLSVEDRGGGLRELLDGEEVLARIRPARMDLAVPAPPSLEQAGAAAGRSLQRTGVRHLFPGCFTCGDGREEGDGLRLFAGPDEGRGVVATPWTPVPSLSDAAGLVRPEFVWAALDCPTIMAAVFASPSDAPGRVVTRQLAVARAGPVRAGVAHVVVAWVVERDARLLLTGGAIVGPDGAVLAVARHQLAQADWGVPLGRGSWR